MDPRGRLRELTLSPARLSPPCPPARLTELNLSQAYLSVLSVASMAYRPSVNSSVTYALKGWIITVLLAGELDLPLPLSHPHELTRAARLSFPSVWVVYAQRDIYPMLTYTVRSADELTTIMWIRLAVITFTALFPPLFTPRPFIPLDPSGHSVPTAEQTSSLFALVFFTFLDPLVFHAWKLPTLSIDDLPAVGDHDKAIFLRTTMLHQLDPHSKDPRAPKGKRHLGWRILRVWWREFAVKCVLSVTYVLLEFSAPLGVNRLLNYLENEGRGAVLKPWVFILAIGVGPLAQGVVFNMVSRVSQVHLSKHHEPLLIILSSLADDLHLDAIHVPSRVDHHPAPV